MTKYLDLSVLPKEITSAGKGRAAPGLPQNFTGGPLPPAPLDGPLSFATDVGTVELESQYGTTGELLTSVDGRNDVLSTSGKDFLLSSGSYKLRQLSIHRLRKKCRNTHNKREKSTALRK